MPWQQQSIMSGDSGNVMGWVNTDTGETSFTPPAPEGSSWTAGTQLAGDSGQQNIWTNDVTGQVVYQQPSGSIHDPAPSEAARMQQYYSDVASGKVPVKDFNTLLSGEDRALSPAEFSNFSPATQAWAKANPQQFIQQLLANRNPANQDLASVGAEGGYQNLGAVTPTASGGLDYSKAGYMNVHDNSGITGLGGVGDALLLGGLAATGFGLAGMGPLASLGISGDAAAATVGSSSVLDAVDAAQGASMLSNAGLGALDAGAVGAGAVGAGTAGTEAGLPQLLTDATGTEVGAAGSQADLAAQAAAQSVSAPALSAADTAAISTAAGTGAADTALTQLPAPVEDAVIKPVTPFDKFMQFIDPVTSAYTGSKDFLTKTVGLPDWLATGILGTGIGALGAGAIKALSPKVTVPTSATTQPGTIRPYTFVQQRNPYWQPIQQGQVYRGGLPFQNQAFVPGTPYQAAQGGAIPGGGIASLGAYSDGGRMVRGPGTGLSDDIPARINGQQEARLADGEFVIPADVVSALGGGSTDSGSKKLYAMLDRVRAQAHGTTQQIRKVPDKVLPK